MRQTKFIFFLILVILTGALIFIILGGSRKDQIKTSNNDVISNLPSPEVLVTNYQAAVGAIFDEARGVVLQQSMTRQDAVNAIREKLLALSGVPKDWQQVHFQLVVALSKDFSGQIEEAKKMYLELEQEAQWLASSLNFLIQ